MFKALGISEAAVLRAGTECIDLLSEEGLDQCEVDDTPVIERRLALPLQAVCIKCWLA